MISLFLMNAEKAVSRRIFTSEKEVKLLQIYLRKYLNYDLINFHGRHENTFCQNEIHETRLKQQTWLGEVLKGCYNKINFD